ncbi:helix-turn-helix domain-containing protein [Lachnospiraceae bacterium 38-14]
MRNPKFVPYETIVRATSGEPEAIDEVLRHYGKRIRLAEYAAALKAQKEQGKEIKPGKKTEKKPSIRAQLKADKERAAQRKQARSKSQDLERS